MKTKSNLLPARLWSGVLGMICLVLPGQTHGGPTQPTADGPPSNQAEAIPWSQLGARAGANYTGDALAITATPEGARLKCGFQKLEGRATAEGLWLESSAEGGGRFRVVAQTVGRNSGLAGTLALLLRGRVSVEGKVARFIRPGLIEEYSVSMDGVRQDFVVLERPPLTPCLSPRRAGEASSGERVVKAAPSSRPSPPLGEKVAVGRLRGRPTGADALRLELAVSGAAAEATQDRPCRLHFFAVCRGRLAVYARRHG